MKISIPFRRWTAKAALEIEVADDTEERRRLGAAVKIAVRSRADLSGADLSRAYLSGAYLQPIKQDVLAEVLRLPNELEALRDAIAMGRIDGSTYSGECACLAGTLAKAHGIETYRGTSIENGPVTFRANARSPREAFFTAIKPGDTPDTSPAAKIALEWTEEAIAIRDMIRGTVRP